MRKSKFLLLVFVCVLLSSCSSRTFYQVCDVQSSLKTSPLGEYEYQDNLCNVTYTFWCNGGNPGFAFTNISDEIIYVDLSKSFFVKNGIAYDYFLQRVTSISTSNTTSSSASKSLSASLSISDTAYGEWKTVYGNYPGSISASAGASASALVANSQAYSKSRTIEIKEKPIVAIPPHSTKVFCEYSICNSYFYECGQTIDPSKKENPSYSYQSDNTPLKFSNFITYTVGDDKTEHSFSNDFFVNKVSFWNANAIVKEKKVGCDKENEIEYVSNNSPKRFYVRYNLQNRTVTSKVKIKKDYDDID